MKIKKKKWPLIRLLRMVIQILCFILLPGLYISAFSGIKQLYDSIIHLSFGVSILPQLIEVMSIIPVTILFGRFFCGWMCAFGAMSDWLYLLSSKIIKHRFTVPNKTDKFLKYSKYILLVAILLIVWSLNINLFGAASPWDAFGMLFTAGKLPDFSYVLPNLLPGFLLLILIIAASLFIERFFCRYLCPLGAIFALASKLRITSITKIRESCGKCRICTKSCPMGIPLYQKDSIKSGECIECLNCVAACPCHNATLAITGKDVRPVIIGTAAVASIAGLYYAGSFTASVLGTGRAIMQSGVSSTANRLYTNGTYQGDGTGFRGTTSVSVTIQNDKITAIKVLTYKDDAQFFNRASSTIISSIISNQSTDVSTVSGATYSSQGILKAVDNALSKARITNCATALTGSEDTAETTSASVNSAFSSSGTNSTAVASSTVSSASAAASSSTSSKVSDNNCTSSKITSSTTSASSAKYKDGTYEGSGQGFRGITTVSVTVQNGSITNVRIVSYQDDERYFDRASPSIIQSVIGKQSTDVSTVSGATFSSKGIIQAIANALNQAS